MFLVEHVTKRFISYFYSIMIYFNWLYSLFTHSTMATGGAFFPCLLVVCWCTWVHHPALHKLPPPHCAGAGLWCPHQHVDLFHPPQPVYMANTATLDLSIKIAFSQVCFWIAPKPSWCASVVAPIWVTGIPILLGLAGVALAYSGSTPDSPRDPTLYLPFHNGIHLSP